MTMGEVRKCPRCPRGTVGRKRWYSLSIPSRSRLIRMGITIRPLGDGTCLVCYRSLKKPGVPFVTVNRREPLERALAEIAAGGAECIEWSGAVSPGGYGRFSSKWAHRITYEATVGPIPTGLHLDHLCRNILCVNPLHLEPVTPAENNRRAAMVKTHCPQGHEYTPENTYFYRYRACRACTLGWQRRKYAADRAAGGAA